MIRRFAKGNLRRAKKPLQWSAQFIRDDPQKIRLGLIQQGEPGVGFRQLPGAVLHQFLQVQIVPPDLLLEPVQFQMRPHPRLNFLRLKGLGHVIHPARLEGAHLLLGFAVGAHKYDRDVLEARIRLQLFAHFVAIHFGHPDIQQNQVRRQQAGRPQGEAAADGHPHGIAALLQQAAKELQIGRGVIHHQNAGAGLGRGDGIHELTAARA